MSQPVLIAIVAFAALFVVVTVIQNRNHRRRMRSLAAERSGESICQFVRSLPYRQLDTSVVRHVYEAVQAEVAVLDLRLPIRTTDHCTDTLEIDREDFDCLVADLADRCGRSLDSYERNPFYGRVQTVGNLVQFLCAQPKAQ
jgi:hypothetical protein